MRVTTNNFLNQLKADMEDKLKNFDFKDKTGKKANIKGYVQALPVLNTRASIGNVAESDNTEVPFFVVRLSDSKIGNGRNILNIYVLLALFDDDKNQKGYETLINCLDEIVFRYQQFNVLGAYTCDDEMEIMLQEDDSFPQFYGGITMQWWTKSAEREIPGWE